MYFIICSDIVKFYKPFNMFPFLYTVLRKVGVKNGSGQLDCKPLLALFLSGSGIPAKLGGPAGDTYVCIWPGALGRMSVPARTSSGVFWTKQDQNKALASISLVAQPTFEPVSRGERFVQLPRVTCCLTTPHCFCCADIFGHCFISA